MIRKRKRVECQRAVCHRLFAIYKGADIDHYKCSVYGIPHCHLPMTDDLWVDSQICEGKKHKGELI